MLFRYLRPVDNNGLCPEIQGGVDVGMGHVAARSASKFTLGLAVCLLAMSAAAAYPAGVFWVNDNHRNAGQLGLIFDEVAELGETPAGYSCPLTLAEPGPVADAREFFKGDAAACVFAERGEFLCDTVVHIFSEPGFLVSDPLHGTSGILAGPAFMPVRHLHAQGPAMFEVFAAGLLDLVATEPCAVARSRDILDAKVNAEKVLRLNGCRIREVGRGIQVEFALAIDEIDLALDPVESALLILPDSDNS